MIRSSISSYNRTANFAMGSVKAKAFTNLATGVSMKAFGKMVAILGSVLASGRTAVATKGALFKEQMIRVDRNRTKDK